jgi:hypothetical protein
MEAGFRPCPGLYARLLGDSWDSLDDAVQRLHASGAPVHAAGVFRVRRGANWLARALARLARLPATGEAVDIQLLVTANDDGEVWRRTFAGRPLVSMQSGRPDGLLGERMGLVETRFQLKVVAGALTYQAAGAALCLGRWRVPLPRWLSPRTSATERTVGDQGRIDVSVEVQLPLLGRLIAYDGRLTCREAPR